MREIKFRGQQINTKQWVYGYLYRNKGLYVICENIRYAEEEPILLDTIGQYTGLKDKNGKEIYEGDIIKFDYREHYNSVVTYIDGAFYLRDKNCEHMPLHEVMEICTDPNSYTIEVIGNIYENPELLEV